MVYCINNNSVVAFINIFIRYGYSPFNRISCQIHKPFQNDNIVAQVIIFIFSIILVFAGWVFWIMAFVRLVMGIEARHQLYVMGLDLPLTVIGCCVAYSYGHVLHNRYINKGKTPESDSFWLMWAEGLHRVIKDVKCITKKANNIKSLEDLIKEAEQTIRREAGTLSNKVLLIVSVLLGVALWFMVGDKLPNFDKPLPNNINYTHGECGVFERDSNGKETPCEIPPTANSPDVIVITEGGTIAPRLGNWVIYKYSVVVKNIGKRTAYDIIICFPTSVCKGCAFDNEYKHIMWVRSDDNNDKCKTIKQLSPGEKETVELTPCRTQMPTLLLTLLIS